MTNTQKVVAGIAVAVIVYDEILLVKSHHQLRRLHRRVRKDAQLIDYLITKLDDAGVPNDPFSQIVMHDLQED